MFVRYTLYRLSTVTDPKCNGIKVPHLWTPDEVLVAVEDDAGGVDGPPERRGGGGHYTTPQTSFVPNPRPPSPTHTASHTNRSRRHWFFCMGDVKALGY